MAMVRLAWKKSFFVIFGRTYFEISLSGAQFDAEADFDVRSAAAPPKPHQIDKKQISETNKNRIVYHLFFRGFWESPSVVGGWNFDSA